VLHHDSKRSSKIPICIYGRKFEVRFHPNIAANLNRKDILETKAKTGNNDVGKQYFTLF
jgi:hypothetical protein